MRKRKKSALRSRYGHAKWHGYESREFAASWPIEDLASAIGVLAHSRGFSAQEFAAYRRGASGRTMDSWTAKRSLDAMLARKLLTRTGKGKNFFYPTEAGWKWIEAVRNAAPEVRRFWER